jgi:hypothetical protein
MESRGRMLFSRLGVDREGDPVVAARALPWHANLGEVTVPNWIWMPWVIPGYVRLFTGAARVGGTAYGYIFDHVPNGWKRQGATCNHGRDLT